ncbi:MAG: DUF4912 domain-containing protein [Nitrospiraceae bacterium]|nr:DUF4912 domain-containing protein [Nitrospiraceae bacterium]
MTKSELTTLTVAELKALAKKKKVSLSSNDRKADIVSALMAAEKMSAKKPVIKKAVTATKTVVKKAVVATKQALKKAVQPRKAAKIENLPVSARRPVAGVPSKATAPAREWRQPPVVEEPLMVQERVSESKYYTGPAMLTEVPAHSELPQAYGEDKIVIMMRDPFVAYAYWEATPARIERERSWFGWDSKLCVRIYDVTGVQFDGRNAIGYFDQEIFDRTGSWYFDLGRPSHAFCADLGLLAPEGRFLTLARSNYITMPLDTASEVIDEEWMLVDEEFWKLYGYPEGMRAGLSSPEMQEMVRRRRLLEITSPGLFSREKLKRKQKQKA